jgi:uncharacterized protein
VQEQDGQTLFSAGDLVAFLECEHATTLALQDQAAPLPRSEDDESLELIQQKGFAHGADILSSMKKQGLRVAELPSDGSTPFHNSTAIDALGCTVWSRTDRMSLKLQGCQEA